MTGKGKDDGVVRPPFTFIGFHHLLFYVGNAKQSADWFCARFGFKRIAYRGLETGDRDYATHVVGSNKIIFAFRSSYEPENTEFGVGLAKHGDGVKDVAFHVDDCKSVFEHAIKNGAKEVSAPKEYSDEHGTVVMASVETYGETIHTLVEIKDYKGVFLPGYRAPTVQDPLTELYNSAGLDFVDHVVGNQPDGEMNPAVEYYIKSFQFHEFWSVDENIVHTEYSALRSVVVADFDENVKMPINEPAPGRKKSQIQEFVEYYGGSGVQHIALNTQDIINAVTVLRKRGVEFLTVPKTYYEDLRARLKDSPVKVAEDLDTIESLDILVDFDDNGYLLQIFTKPLQDRPTVFLEVIQRRQHDGFGAGNFKSLFEAIEREQEERGNL